MQSCNKCLAVSVYVSMVYRRVSETKHRIETAIHVTVTDQQYSETSGYVTVTDCHQYLRQIGIARWLYCTREDLQPKGLDTEILNLRCCLIFKSTCIICKNSAIILLKKKCALQKFLTIFQQKVYPQLIL